MTLCHFGLFFHNLWDTCAFSPHASQRLQKILEEGTDYVARDSKGNELQNTWVGSDAVSVAAGGDHITINLLYFNIMVPKPTTTTLSLLALTALCTIDNLRLTN